MVKGKVTFFHDEKGYGFIEREGEEDVFFHISEVDGTSIDEGQEVEFEVEQAERGPRAVNVKRV